MMKADRANRKAFFAITSTAQAEMVKSIAEQLHGWDILAINENKWYKRKEVERTLESSGLPYKTIRSCSAGAIKRILKEEQPGVVIFGHDGNAIDRLFIKCANSEAIPTLLVQDGILAASREKPNKGCTISPRLEYLSSLPHSVFRFIRNKDYSWRSKIAFVLLEWRYGTRWNLEIYGHGECSKMAVFGHAVKRTLLSEGIKPERIVITGNPKFDKLFYSRDGNCKQKVCEKWGIPIDNEIILLLTGQYVEGGMWSPYQRRKFILAIAHAVATLPHARLVIKLHPPQENKQDYNEIVKDLPYPPIICKYAPIHELLNACSLAMSVSSAAALEAMSLGKAVVLVNLFNDAGALFYRGSGALFAEKEEDILPAINKALYDSLTKNKTAKSMENFVYQQAYLQDGQASKRIADLITEMAAASDSH